MLPAKTCVIQLDKRYNKQLFDLEAEKKDLMEKKDYMEQFLKDVNRAEIYLDYDDESVRLAIRSTKDRSNREFEMYIHNILPEVDDDGVSEIRRAIVQLCMQGGNPANINAVALQSNIYFVGRDLLGKEMNPETTLQLQNGRYKIKVKLNQDGKLIVNVAVDGKIMLGCNKYCGSITSISTTTLQFDQLGHLSADPTFTSSIVTNNPYLQKYINSESLEDLKKNIKLMESIAMPFIQIQDQKVVAKQELKM